MLRKGKTTAIKVEGFDSDWSIHMDIKHMGVTRHIAQSVDGEQVMIVIEEDGLFQCAIGPYHWEQARLDAQAILFNRGSSVDGLKAVAAGFLVMMSQPVIVETPIS